jgi:hypothetical protein
MITAVLAAWLLFNIVFAGWLIWARIIRPDRAKLRLERERHAAADDYDVQRRQVRT